MPNSHFFNVPQRSLLLLGFFLVFCASCHQKPVENKNPPIPIQAFQVEPQTIPAEFEFIGVAKSSHPVEIRSRVEGYLISINYTEGSEVSAGDLLFRIDPRQFEASVEEAEGELARQKAILWRAQKSLERIQPLYQKKAASERDLDFATAQVLASEATVISAEANLTKAKLNLSYTYIISPIKGWSGRAISQEGTLITPATNGLLTYVSVINPIWVDFTVSDNELLQGKAEGAAKSLILPPENEYSVSLELADGSQFPHKGTVNFSSPTLDPQTGTLLIRATFDNPHSEILPGQFVRAKASGAFRPEALIVPQTAVFQGRKGMYLFVVGEDHKVTSRSVEVGAWYKEYWIIKGGLEPGDIVVSEGINKIQEGSPVQVTSLKKFSPEKK